MSGEPLHHGHEVATGFTGCRSDEFRLPTDSLRRQAGSAAVRRSEMDLEETDHFAVQGLVKQAMAGLKDVEGVQTHRSWRVARAAIVGVVADGRKLRLRLTGGLEAPVSRARIGALREEGWLVVTPAS